MIGWKGCATDTALTMEDDTVKQWLESKFGKKPIAPITYKTAAGTLSVRIDYTSGKRPDLVWELCNTDKNITELDRDAAIELIQERMESRLS